MTGVMIAAIDTTIVILALPVMMSDLHSNLVTIIWVILSYLLVVTVLGTQVGRIGDMFGRVKMYNFGFVLFAAGSALCGLSTNSIELILFRIVQGIGGALISSNSGAIIADTFPAEGRGKAYGVTAVGWSAGAILGILLGGIIITFINWRFIFFINVPIGLIAFFVGRKVLQERINPQKSKFDIPGMVLIGGSLLCLLLGLTAVVSTGADLFTIVTFILSVALFLSFVSWENRAEVPLLRLSILRRRILTAFRKCRLLRLR
jgi:MFS family permease